LSLTFSLHFDIAITNTNSNTITVLLIQYYY